MTTPLPAITATTTRSQTAAASALSCSSSGCSRSEARSPACDEPATAPPIAEAGCDRLELRRIGEAQLGIVHGWGPAP